MRFHGDYIDAGRAAVVWQGESRFMDPKDTTPRVSISLPRLSQPLSQDARLPVDDQLKRSKAAVHAQVARYQGSHLLKLLKAPMAIDGSQVGIDFDDASWTASYEAAAIPCRPDAYRIAATFTLAKGRSPSASVGIGLAFTDWSTANYVLMPGAAYNGNRFESRHMEYPPQLSDPRDIGPDVPTIISDVPRLALHKGMSRLQLLTRDLSTPAIGFHDPRPGTGFWLLTRQGTHLGDSGIGIEENDDRDQAIITLTAPGVREDTRYHICTTRHPSDDRGADFREGDSVKLEAALYFFECPSIQALFDRFVEIRKDLTGVVKLYHQIPFSSAWEIQEQKYNRDNWDERYGYYSVAFRDNIFSCWQVGLVGGMMVTYPFLFEGSEDSRSRALRNFDFAFPDGQGKSGFFHGCGDGQKWYGDNFAEPFGRPWHLLRKSGDALYYVIKQLMLMQKQDPLWRPPDKWAAGARRCSDAFVRLWDTWGQFGQFVDVETGGIIVGGSTSAGIASAGLALAWRYFGDERYLRVAKSAAAHYFEKYVKAGITTGGPCDCCQCPDSESAYGLLESFIVLYEETAEARWIEAARDVGNQFFTWCVSYDYRFPPSSTFGQLDMHSTGAVYANAQNKHAAPGICTHSGVALFKLYRATGSIRYLELLREMAHNLTLFLSRADRPIGGMPAGWINERVNLSDWCEPIGEICYGSNWCEVSNMLTYVEVPGLYVQPDTSFFCAIDHIDVEVAENAGERLVLTISNPTRFKAVVKVFSELSTEMSKPLGQNALWGCRRIELAPSSRQDVAFAKERSD